MNPGAYVLPKMSIGAETSKPFVESKSEPNSDDDASADEEGATTDVIVDRLVVPTPPKPLKPPKIDDATEKSVTQAEGYESLAWIAGSDNQLGMIEWIARDLAVYDYTATNRSRFRVSPGYAMRWLNGPDSTDLPPYLFSIFADVGMGIRMSNSWVMDTVISPSWNTDFANKGYKLFRLPWQIVNSFQLDNEFRLILGVTDLARDDIHVLPVAGFSYAPTDGSKQFDLIFPRPRMAWRLSHRDEDSHWGYVLGELGGGSFSILREDRQNDIVTLRDYRLIAGWERRGKKGHASRWEAGWIFGRAVEYQSNQGNYHPGDTAIIRVSSDY